MGPFLQLAQPERPEPQNRSQEKQLKKPSKMTRTLLIALDGSENAERAFHFYIDNIYREGDMVHLVYVNTPPHLSLFSMDNPMSLPVDEWKGKIQTQIAESQKILGHYESFCESKHIAKKPHIQQGTPGEVICATAAAENVSFIVMGSRGLNSVRRTFTGSVSDYVLRHAHVPVTVVPPPAK